MKRKKQNIKCLFRNKNGLLHGHIITCTRYLYKPKQENIYVRKIYSSVCRNSKKKKNPSNKTININLIGANDL